MTEKTFDEGGAANRPPFPPRPEPSSRSDSPAAGYEPGPGDDEPLLSTAAESPRRAAEELKRRIDRALHHGICHFADQLDDLGSRLDSLGGSRLQRLGGGGERAAEAAGAVSGWLTSTADYLRTTEVADLRGDLEEQVRSRPVQTLAASMVAGWVLGKIVK